VRLFGKLPAEQGRHLLALWHEFEAANTDDARFARAIDRIQPLLLHWASDGTAWAERRVTVEQERRIMSAVDTYWPALAPTAAALIDDAHRRGLLPAGADEAAGEAGADRPSAPADDVGAG
jgi:putative hydrolase of HD superfamily